MKATNGQVIAVSETYNAKASCLKGIESVRNSCAGEVEDQTVESFEIKKHPKFEVYADKAGEFRFRLKAVNGQIVAVSEGYKTLKSCLDGVQSVKNNAPDAEIVEEDAEA